MEIPNWLLRQQQAPNQAWLDAVAECERELNAGITPAPELYIQSGGYDGGYSCEEIADALIPTGDFSFSNGIPWSGGSPTYDTGFDKIDDDVDSPNTSDYIRYNYSYPGPGDVLIVSDVFAAGALPSWPTSAKLRICCADFSGGGASGQWNLCSLKDANGLTIGQTAFDDVPVVSGTTPQVMELDLVLASYSSSFDLSSTRIVLRLSNGNVCDVRVYAVEVEYGVPCPCEPNPTLRPNCIENGWLGTVHGEGTRCEILSTNDFESTEYENYLNVVESVGGTGEYYEAADAYSIGRIGAWPTDVTVRVRAENMVFPVTAAVMAIWINDQDGNELAKWGPDYRAIGYGTPDTYEFELTVNPYDADLNLDYLVLTTRYALNSGIINDSDLNIYAYAVDFDLECPDVVIGEGGFLIGGSNTNTMTYAPSLSGGYSISGESLVLSGIIPSGGLTAGGSASVSASYDLAGSGGVAFGGFPYRYRRTITVPAGKVTTDLDGFVLGVIVEIPPEKAGSKWLFTNANLVTLPHEIREYTNGRLTAYVRTPLKAAEDNTIYLYYGAP